MNEDRPWWLKTGCSHPEWYPEIPREDWFMAQEIAMDRRLEYMMEPREEEAW